MQPESQDGALTTVIEVPSKENLDTESTEKQSTPSVLEEEIKAEVSTQRSARRSQGGQGDLQKTPSLYTSQDLSGDDFFDLDKLEREIDELNKKFNEMQTDWQQVMVLFVYRIVVYLLLFVSDEDNDRYSPGE